MRAGGDRVRLMLKIVTDVTDRDDLGGVLDELVTEGGAADADRWPRD